MADRTSTVRVRVLTDASGGISGLTKFAKLTGVAALGLAGLTAGAVVGADKLYDFGDAAGDANDRIETVTRNMGLFKGRVQEVAGRIEDYARTMSDATAVDINLIKSTQAKLLAFKDVAATADEAGSTFDRATQAAVDLGSLGFGTAESNAVKLGRALNDPINNLDLLKRTGIEFTDAEKEKIKALQESGDLLGAQSFMLQQIEKRSKGAAEAQAGAWEQLKTKAKNAAQELATRIQPIMDDFARFLDRKAIPRIREWGESFRDEVLPRLRRVKEIIEDDVIPAIEDFIKWVDDKLVPTIKKSAVPALDGMRDAFARIGASIRKDRQEGGDLQDALAKLVQFLNKVVAPVVGFVMEGHFRALGAAVQYVITICSNWLQTLKDLWGWIQNVVDKLESLYDKIRNPPSLHIPGAGILGDILGSGGNPTRGRAAAPSGEAPRVTVNFNGLVTDPRAAAREVDKVLRRAGVAGGVAVGA